MWAALFPLSCETSAHKKTWSTHKNMNWIYIHKVSETLLCQNLLNSLAHTLLYFKKVVKFKQHIIFSCRNHKIDHPLTPRWAKILLSQSAIKRLHTNS